MAKATKDARSVRVYKYGAKAPITSIGEVRTQARLAHEYGNKQIELERSRRQKVDDALTSMCPELKDVEARIVGLEEQVESILTEIGKRNSVERKKRTTPAERSELQAVKKLLSAARKQRKELRSALFACPDWVQRNEIIEAEYKEASNALNIEYGNLGVYWGTRQIIDKATRQHPDFRKGAPPKFKRWDGCFAVGVQIQSSSPLTTEDVFVKGDSRFQIDIPNNLKNRTKARIRIGSMNARGERTTRGGSTPVWAEFQVTIHRPLPPDAQIQRVEYHCNRIGTREEWSIHITVKADDSAFDPGDRADSGTVAVDVGWRDCGDKGFRVAYWMGDDGQEGELYLPKKIVDGFEKCEEIKSLRDTHFNGVRDVLTAWLKGRECPEYLSQHIEKLKHDAEAYLFTVIPAYLKEEIEACEALLAAWGSLGTIDESLKEDTKHIHQWKGIGRIHVLLRKWGEGDDTVRRWLSSWAKRDDVLNNWHSNFDKKLRRHRDAIYKKFAAKMRRMYRTVAIEDFDLRQVARDKGVESSESTKNAAGGQRQKAAVSILISALGHSMAETVKVNPAYTSQECTKCGNLDKTSDQMITCTGCGHTEDRDYRGAANILNKARAAVLEKPSTPLAKTQAAKTTAVA